jgi:hypothetical protein
VRKDTVAETLLSLVGSPDRARALVGDLMEEAGRGRVWFWQSVTRLWFAMLGRDLTTAPIAMALYCAAGWFVYMLLSLAMAFAAYIVVTLAWGAAYVLANHTGLELLTNALRIRFDWPPIPGAALYAIQAVVLFAAAPFHIGRCSAFCWRGHEVSVAVVMVGVWSLMAAFVPLVGVGISARPSMVPVMVMFALAGALVERFRAEAPRLQTNR